MQRVFFYGHSKMNVAQGAGESSTRWPIDAHVHFHRFDFVEPTLDWAATNFEQLGRGQTLLLGALFLAETSRENVFARLRDEGNAGSWEFCPVAGEPQTLLARSGSREIVIITGRQIRCRSGLELLALGSTEYYPDGLTLDDAMRQVLADRVLAILPWGFGKWTGRRGKVVRDLLQRLAPKSFFLGDNGGRIQSLGMPKMLRDGRAAGVRVLPGSDPFPFGDDYKRVGRFGCFANFNPDPLRPWGTIKQWLEDPLTTPDIYGQATDTLRFFLYQIWIQLHNARIGGLKR